MDPLASLTDLSDRGIDVTSGNVFAFLTSASDAIRAAAGSPISRTTATITLGGTAEQWLPVPLAPIRAVSDVAIGESPVTDWKLVDGRLWRSGGWGSWCEPSNVTLTVDAGFDEVPGDVVDLCCALVAAAVGRAAGGYDPGRGVTSVAIDDYQESRASGDAEQVSVFELPQRTKDWLQQTYGTAAAVVGTY